MAKVLVAYESKYGNTKVVAEKIAEGLKAEGVEAVVQDFKKVDYDKFLGYDAILIGCPTHFGGPTRGARGFIDKLGKLRLRGKMFAVFDTYLGEDFEKGVKKMETRISEKVAGGLLLLPGLSVRVEGMKGPIVEGELGKAVEFGRKVAGLLKTR